jgi:hypothetical protein
MYHNYKYNKGQTDEVHKISQKLMNLLEENSNLN